jgi:NAD(P)H-flavin reductase
LSRAEASWTGLRGHVQEPLARIVEERAARLGQPLHVPAVDPTLLNSELNFDIYAYICGLNEMVFSVRESLTAFGWHKKQIVFERYD